MSTTPVELYFVTPAGDPVVNSEVEIQLLGEGTSEHTQGIALPRTLFAITDDFGKAIVNLWPAKGRYGALARDSQSTAEVYYEFYVPVTDGLVRFQDIIMVNPPSPVPYDEEAIRQITQIKADVLVAQDDVIAKHTEVLAVAGGLEAQAVRAEEASQTALDTEQRVLLAQQETFDARDTSVSAAQTSTEQSSLAIQAAEAASLSEQAAKVSEEAAADSLDQVEALAQQVSQDTSTVTSWKDLVLVARDAAQEAEVSALAAMNHIDQQVLHVDAQVELVNAARDAAELSKINARDSELAAQAAAVAAAASEGVAITKAQQATDAERVATAKALEASEDAQTAITQAAAAANSVTQAQAHRNVAVGAATAAANSASQAEAARDRAEIAAQTVTGSIVDMGAISLVTGNYPSKPLFSAFWKVTAGGIVDGVEYGIGDTLVYSKNLDVFYKIDNTEQVTSVNGKKGAVTLGKADVGLNLVDNTPDMQKPLSDPQWDELQTELAATRLTLRQEAAVALDTKVDKIAGKGLSTNDFTTAEKNKLANANLTALVGLTGAADRLPYFTGAGALSLATLTAAARTLLAATNVAGQQSALGLFADASGVMTNASGALTNFVSQLLQSADAAAGRSALGLGTAATWDAMTSLTDESTPNALMPRGAFGLGAGLVMGYAGLQDTPLSVASGLYAAEASTIGSPGGLGTNVWGTLVHLRTSNFVTQKYIVGNKSSARVFTRRFFGNPGNWSDWVEFFHTGNQLSPAADNLRSIGEANKRWSTAHLGTAPIVTSDRDAKQDILPIDDAVLDAWTTLGYMQYRLKDAVAAKGEEARIHAGLIAQDIKEAFESAGLDPFRYGVLCYDEWEDEVVEHPAEYEWITVPAVLDDEGNEVEPERQEQGELIKEAWTEVVREAGHRYSVRYEEAFALECALQRRTTQRLEQRLAALELAVA